MFFWVMILVVRFILMLEVGKFSVLDFRFLVFVLFGRIC